MKCAEELIAELDHHIRDIRHVSHEQDHEWTEHEMAIRILDRKYDSHHLHTGAGGSLRRVGRDMVARAQWPQDRSSVLGGNTAQSAYLVSQRESLYTRNPVSAAVHLHAAVTVPPRATRHREPRAHTRAQREREMI